jgi:hypothetical protein
MAIAYQSRNSTAVYWLIGPRLRAQGLEAQQTEAAPSASLF